MAAIGGGIGGAMTGLFFLVMTLVFSQVMWGLSHRWGSMTGGYLGLHGIPRPCRALESELTFYYAGLGVFLVSGPSDVSLGAVALRSDVARHQGQ